MKYHEKKDGPTLVVPPVPPTPQPYMSCDECKHFHETMSSTSGQGNAPLYYKACHHPIPVASGRTSITKGTQAEDSGYTVTPEWCPCLKENK